MKKIIKTLIIIVGVLCAATSCLQTERDSTLVYGYTAIGNMKDGVFVSDYNQKFHILIKDCEGSLDTCNRVVVFCDILSQLDQEGQEYNIRLRGFTSPLVSDPVPASKAGEVGPDPIDMTQGWFSANYLNMYIRYTYDPKKKTEQKIALVYDDTRSNTDTLYFSLKCNGEEENLVSGKYKMSELALGHTYASFPVAQYVPAGKKDIVVSIGWDWYECDASGNVISSVVQHFRDNAKYSTQWHSQHLPKHSSQFPTNYPCCRH